MPEWVRLIPISDVDTAERSLVALLAEGQARPAEYESVASEVVEGAVEQGIWVLGLATPPGRLPALLSVTGFRLPITVDRHTTTDLLSYLEDHGGPGIAGLRFVPLGYDKTALLFQRTSSSGSQAQAFVPDALAEDASCSPSPPSTPTADPSSPSFSATSSTPPCRRSSDSVVLSQPDTQNVFQCRWSRVTADLVQCGRDEQAVLGDALSEQLHRRADVGSGGQCVLPWPVLSKRSVAGKLGTAVVPAARSVAMAIVLARGVTIVRPA